MLDDILFPHFTTLSLDLITCKCTRTCALLTCSLDSHILARLSVSGVARTFRIIPSIYSWYFINIYLD